jgi:signal transduction histidine kinase
MRSNKWIALALAFVPLFLGITASLLAQEIWDPVPILVFKIDTGMVAFMGGLIFSLICFSYLLGTWITHKKADRLVEDTVKESDEGRRRFIRRLDHEIKNPLTGLRAAMVNLQEAQSKERVAPWYD